MALKLLINISKKVPGPQEYSSIQSSVSIENEISVGQDPIAEAARLQSQAEQAVDRFLGIELMARPTPSQAPAPQAALPQGPTTAAPSASPGQRPAASQPYRNSSTAQRRGPAPVTDSQLRFLDRLITQTGSSVPAILQQHQVGALRDLSCKAAAGLIDELKGQAVPS